MLLSLLLATSAAWAGHVSIDCTNPSLTDLNAAIQANFGPSGGGFSLDSVASSTAGNRQIADSHMRVGNIYSIDCHYVNGFDMVHAYVMADFLNPGGTYSGSTNLYAGWVVAGIAGDVDGDGNPDVQTSTNPLCGGSVLLDQPGIGSAEAYVLNVIFCGGQTLQFQVTSNSVQVTRNGTLLGSLPPGVTTSFAYSNVSPFGPTVKMCVTNLEALMPGVTLNGAVFALTSNALFDFLAEDGTTAPMKLDIPARVLVTKVPAQTNVCPGSTLGYTITISNPGPATLDSVAVNDVLGNGLTYITDDHSSTGDATHRSWNFPAANLAPGQNIVIHLSAQVAFPCAAPTLVDSVHVLAASLCASSVITKYTTADTTALVNCSSPGCSITPSNPSICPGGSVQLCGPEGLRYVWSTGDTTRCITVNTTGPFRLITTNAAGCHDTCSVTVVQIPPPPCGITPVNPVVCQNATLQLCAELITGLAPSPTAPILYHFLWSTGDTTPCITVNTATIGSRFIRLTVTNAAGCASTCSTQVTVVPPPPCGIGPMSPVVCQNQTLQLCFTGVPDGPSPATFVGAFRFRWSTGDTTPCITVNTSLVGSRFIKLTVLNAASCSTTCSTQVTVVPPAPCTITPGDTTICTGQMITFCGPAEVGLHYLWSTGDTTRCITVSAPNTYQLITTRNGGLCPDTCRVTLSNKVCLFNCPRTVGFWGAQCAQKQNGSTKFTKAQVTQIAQCVDALSSYFNFGTAPFDSFCAIINPPTPMGILQQTKRQLAGLLANACTGSLGLVAANGDSIKLDLNTAINCGGATTIAGLVQRVDSLLKAIGSSPPTASQRTLLGILETCLDNFNNGIGIGATCGTSTVITVTSTDGLAQTMSQATLQPAPPELPKAFALHANMPNPFTHLTSIRFALPVDSRVQLAVYDVRGRLLSMVADDGFAAGEHVISWRAVDGSGQPLSGGVYFCRMQATGSTGQHYMKSIRMTLAR